MLLIILLSQLYFVRCNCFTIYITFRLFENWSTIPKWNHFPEETSDDFSFAPGSVAIYTRQSNFGLPPPRFDTMKRRYQKKDPTKTRTGGKTSPPPISRNASPRSDNYRQRRDDDERYYRGAYGPPKFPEHYYTNRRSENRRSPPSEPRRQYENGYSNKAPQLSRPYRGDEYDSRQQDDRNHSRDRRRPPLNQHRQTSRKYHYGERQNDRNRERSKSPKYSPERPRKSEKRTLKT